MDLANHLTEILSIATITIGSLSIFFVRRYINRIRKKRLNILEKRKSVSSILTESPLDKPSLEFKEEGAESISKRFSIIRESLTVLIILAIIVLSIIPFLNLVPATIVSIVAGSFAVVIGIASKPFIENYISGIIIGLNRTFSVGDTILLGDKYGIIEDISLTSTIVKMWDWRRVILPNTLMLQKEVISYTLHDNFIWMKVEFWVSFDTDLETVKQAAIQASKSSSYFSNFEEPSFWVMEMGKDGYKCWVAAWSNTPARAWELGNDIRSQMIIHFQKSKIKSHAFHVKLDQDNFHIKETGPSPHQE